MFRHLFYAFGYNHFNNGTRQGSLFDQWPPNPTPTFWYSGLFAQIQNPRTTLSGTGDLSTVVQMSNVPYFTHRPSHILANIANMSVYKTCQLKMFKHTAWTNNGLRHHFVEFWGNSRPLFSLEPWLPLGRQMSTTGLTRIVRVGTD